MTDYSPRYPLIVKTFQDERYRIVENMDCNISHESDGDIIIGWEAMNMYGVGATLAEALLDFESTLIEYYLILEDDLGKSPYSYITFNYLRRFVMRND